MYIHVKFIIGASISGRRKNLFLLGNGQTGSGTHTASYSAYTGGVSPGGKGNKV